MGRLKEFSAYGKLASIVKEMVDADHPTHTTRFYACAGIPYVTTCVAALRAANVNSRNGLVGILATRVWTLRGTHALLVAFQPGRIHIYDPNGSSRARVSLDGTSDFRTFPEILHVKNKCGGRAWSYSCCEGYQPKLPDFSASTYIRNQGYCMLVCWVAARHCHASTSPVECLRKLDTDHRPFGNPLLFPRQSKAIVDYVFASREKRS